jgi:hypothetical protein
VSLAGPEERHRLAASARPGFRSLKANFVLLGLLCLLAILQAMRLPGRTRDAFDLKEILDEETYQDKAMAAVQLKE